MCALLVSGCAESPESPEVLVARGHLMESRGKLDDAVDAYTRALARRPDDATIYYDRGVALGRLRRWDDAIADYTQAIEHDPGMARAYNNRAAAYAQQRRFDAAVADFTKTISLDSKSALAYRNRGLAYHDLGQITPSIEDYTVAIRLDPNDFESRFERGNVYLDAGRLSESDRRLRSGHRPRFEASLGLAQPRRGAPAIGSRKRVAGRHRRSTAARPEPEADRTGARRFRRKLFCLRRRHLRMHHCGRSEQSPSPPNS